MHVEAVRRMGLMCVHDETIRQFAEEGRISKSEPPFGAFYWVDSKELEEIRSWEAEHGARVYMVVRSYTEYGTMDAYLYVSKHKNELFTDCKPEQVQAEIERAKEFYTRDLNRYKENLINYLEKLLI